MLLEMNISLSHVQNTFFLQTLWYGNWTRGIGSKVKFPVTKKENRIQKQGGNLEINNIKWNMF